MPKILGYTYEAAVHCLPCTGKRFAVIGDTTTDREGNPVQPVFSTDEHDPSGEYCDDCGEVLVEASVVTDDPLDYDPEDEDADEEGYPE